MSKKISSTDELGPLRLFGEVFYVVNVNFRKIIFIAFLLCSFKILFADDYQSFSDYYALCNSNELPVAGQVQGTGVWAGQDKGTMLIATFGSTGQCIIFEQREHIVQQNNQIIELLKSLNDKKNSSCVGVIKSSAG